LVISSVPRFKSGQGKNEHKFFSALLPSWYIAHTSLPRLPRVVICDLGILPLALHLLSWLLVLAGAGRVETESGGTRCRTGGEVKGKEANGVGSQAVFSLTRNSLSSVTTIVLP